MDLDQFTSNEQRLLRMVAMLPQPGAEEYELFWKDVAHEMGDKTDYVTGKMIAEVSQALSRDPRQPGPGGHHRGLCDLACRMMYLFNDPSETLLGSIGGRLNNGQGPLRMMGRTWVNELHHVCLTVLVDAYDGSALQERLNAWVIENERQRLERLRNRAQRFQ
ncbi:hypothetical protein [Nocardiopsis nanhaiensis]